MKIKNNKVLKISFYTVLILSAICFTKFPSTYSYFTHTNDTELVYKSKLHNLYNEHSMNLDSAAVQTAKFSFSFKPGKVLEKEQTDSYQITIPEACVFEKTVPSTGATFTEQTEHSRTISFSKEANRDGENYIYIACTIDKSSEMVDFSSRVIGKVNEINHSFIYKDFSYKESYEEYLARINETVDSSGPLTGDNLYQKFLDWINTYSQKSGYKLAIETYLTSVYKDEKSLKDPANFNKLEGFSVEYNSTTKKYTFKVLNNFVGYARTYYSSTQPAGKYADIYFSTNTKVRLNQALKYYLNAYIYPNSPTSANLVYDYIINNGGIYSVILNGNRITGLSLGEYNTTTMLSTVTINKSLLLSMAISAKEKTPCVTFNDYNTMLYTNFRNALSLTAPSIGISDATAKSIYARADIVASVTKNNTSTTPQSFTDYFIHPDGNRQLLIKVSSDITKDPLYNKLAITPLSTPDGMALTFANIENGVKVTITHTDKTSVLKTVSDLNGYFHTSITESNVTVLVDQDNSYSIEYIISK